MPSKKLTDLTAEALYPMWNDTALTLPEIAKSLGVCEDTLRTRAKELGMPKRSNRRNSKGADLLFITLWKLNISATDIARIIGFTDVSIVHRKRKIMGLPKRDRTAIVRFSEWKDRRYAKRMVVAA